ncbi:MAG: site-2 protease family protein, partial [Bacilli bacterium]
MPFLQTLLNIVIFLLCLSFVVCIHELGHFSMAKLFKVYCFEYSIGFGPAIFHKKVRHRVKKGTRPVFTEPTKEIKNNESQMSVTDIEPIKPLDSSVSEVNQGLLNLLNASQKSDEERVKKEEKPIKQSDKYDYYYGETYISIRCLPLGGYVSMAGEDGEENEDGVKVPKERAIPGINHFKRIIIMMAGIVMNFLLAFILFFADFAFCPQQASIIGTNAITVSEKINDEESPAYTAGLRTGDKILTLYQTYNGLLDNNDQTKVTDGLEFPAVADRQEITCYQNSGIQTADDYSFDSISYAIQDVLAHNNSETLTKIPGFEGLQAGENSTRVLHITYLDFEDQTTKTLPDVTLKTQLSNDAYTFGKLGISVATEEFYFTAGEAFVNAGKQ